MKRGKACGLDDICGEFLKHANSLVVPFLANVFNRLYDTTYFPLDWGKLVIIPLLKKKKIKERDRERATIKTQTTTEKFRC